MYPSRRARTDPNQKEIAEALRRAGALVYYIRWPLDLVVVFRGKVELLEVKAPMGVLNDNQKRIVQDMAYKGYWPRVVRSAEEALRAIGAIDEPSPG